MTGVLAAIELLWKIVQGAIELVRFIEANQDEKWFQDSAEIFTKLKEAKTPDEKKAIVRGIGDLWSRV